MKLRSYFLMLLAAIGSVLAPSCERRSTPAEAPPEPGPSSARAPEATENAVTPVAPETKVAEPVEVAPKLDKALLWRFEDKKGSGYLFGTIHMGVTVQELPDVVTKSVDGAKQFVMEADLTKLDPTELMAMAMYPAADPGLRDKLTPAQLAKAVEMSGFPENQVLRMRPWFLVINITQRLVQAGFPMDMALLNRAQEAGKDTWFLETWKQQIEMLAGAMDVPDLLEMIDDPDAAQKELTDLVDAYRAGDREAMERLTFDEEKMKKNPRLYEVLFRKRNEAWVPKIEASLNKGELFVAVGAGHLVGKYGLITLLEKRGYKLTRVD